MENAAPVIIREDSGGEICYSPIAGLFCCNFHPEQAAYPESSGDDLCVLLGVKDGKSEVVMKPKGGYDFPNVERFLEVK